MGLPMKDLRISKTPCACGCGSFPLIKRKWVKGHRPLKPTAQGYIRIWVTPAHPLAGKDGNALEHRLVLYNAGIEIPAGWHVHHRNGDKTDNRLENLELLSAAEHHRQHARHAGLVQNQYGIWPVRR